MKNKNAQISMEYLVIMGFVTFIIIGLFGVAFIYSGGTKDQIKINQLSNFANKVISTAENVFFRGEPSKATITAYLPENIEEITISEEGLFFTIHTNTGKNIISFSSDAPLSGSLTIIKGLKRIQFIAQEDSVQITES